MKNVTITLDEKTATWVRMEAVRRDIGVSQLIRELLEEYMREKSDHMAAMGRFLSRPAVPLKREGRYPSRDEIHDRAGLR